MITLRKSITGRLLWIQTSSGSTSPILRTCFSVMREHVHEKTSQHDTINNTIPIWKRECLREKASAHDARCYTNISSGLLAEKNSQLPIIQVDMLPYSTQTVQAGASS
jgi:hypothetical protein